jgi:hypothetical protein
MAKAKKSAGKSSRASKAAKRLKYGTFMGVRIADPPVKPRGITVREIRRAVATVLGRRSA